MKNVKLYSVIIVILCCLLVFGILNYKFVFFRFYTKDIILDSNSNVREFEALL